MHAPQEGGKGGDSPESPEWSNPNGALPYPGLAWKDCTWLMHGKYECEY